MKNIKNFIIFLKNNFFTVLLLFFTISLVVFSKKSMYSAKTGLDIFINSIIPSLFPFFIATELLSSTNIIQLVGKLLNKFMKPIFNLPGEAAYAFLIGIISGYPVGAKIVTTLRKNELCSKLEGERMLALCNNSGPLFIVGTVRNRFVWQFSNWIFITYNSYIFIYYCWYYFRIKR